MDATSPPSVLEEFFETAPLVVATPCGKGDPYTLADEDHPRVEGSMSAALSVLSDMLNVEVETDARECFGIVLGKNGIIELAEGSTERLLGISQEHLVGQSILSLVALSERHRVCGLLPSASGTSRREMECEFISFRTGKRIMLELKSRLVTATGTDTNYHGVSASSAEIFSVDRPYVACVARRSTRPPIMEPSQQLASVSSSNTRSLNLDALQMPMPTQSSCVEISQRDLQVDDTPGGRADRRIARRVVDRVMHRPRTNVRAPTILQKPGAVANYEWTYPVESQVEEEERGKKKSAGNVNGATPRAKTIKTKRRKRDGQYEERWAAI